MDSREAQSQSAHHHHQQHHQHHQQQPFHMNSFHLPNNNNSSMYNPNSVSSNNNNRMMMQQQQQQQQQQQEARFPFNQAMFTTPSKPYDSLNHNNVSSNSNNNNNGMSFDVQGSGLAPCNFSLEQPEKRKRGRPKKYTAEGNIALGLSQAPISPLGHDDFTAPVTAATAATAAAPLPSGESQVKRGRGRPPGSGKKQLDALGPSGVGFTPHVITIQPGEDIASKIIAFSHQGTRTVCILSANGAVCNVTLRQPSLPNGSVTYEERFEIISLSGSFSLSESNGSQSRKAELSISFAAPDGRVMGGAVVGVLVAATPVQVILGSFASDGKKPNSATTPSSAPPGQIMNFGGAAGAAAASPSSHGGSNNSSDENGSSPLDSAGYGTTYNNGNQPIHSMPSYPAIWGSPDMNTHPN